VCGRAAGNTLRTQKQTESKSVNAEIVQTPSWRYKTIVVIKRQQQTAISNFSIRALQLSAGSYQDLINWYCSLLTRRTVCGRAAGNTLRTQKQTEWKSVNAEIVQTPSWRYKTIVVIKRQQQTAIRALQLYITVLKPKAELSAMFAVVFE